jgi:hypothetical protein
MRAASEMSLKARITRMLWIGNALVGVLLALHGALMSFEVFSFDAQLSALSLRAGTLLAILGTALTVYSLAKARSLSASRG